MRADLLDAQASVDWAVAQIPILQERFMAWQKLGAYELVMEDDPADASYKFLIAHQRSEIDPLIRPEAGAIINALRSSLDLLAAALAARNCVKSNRNTHFPIFKTLAGFLDAKHGMDSDKVKKWLSPAEIATIKSLKPYSGGDDVLFPLHELDVLRKHERLLISYPDIGGAWIEWPRADLETIWNWGLRGNNEAVLYRLRVPSRLGHTKPQANISPEIYFHEPAIGIVRQPAGRLLRRFAGRVSEIIRLFDS